MLLSFMKSFVKKDVLEVDIIEYKLANVDANVSLSLRDKIVIL